MKQIACSNLPQILLLSLLLSGHALAGCEATVWRSYNGVDLWQFPGSTAYFYVTAHMAIDADGAPNAYHPEDKGIDALANAGYPHKGWKSVLVVDPNDHDKPYVQREGEFAGYFVAKTSLQDRTLPETATQRYVDSRSVPYVVFPGTFHALKGTGTLGDFALARNLSNDKETPAIVADIGPSDADLGEVSIGLAEKLGGTDVSPRTGRGAPKGKVLYVIFPKSKDTPAWPLTGDQMQKRTSDLMASLGGWDKILACVK